MRARASDETLAFLRALHPEPEAGQWIELKTKHPKKRGAFQSWFLSSDLEAVAVAAEAANRRGENVWCAPNPRVRDGGGTSDDVAAFPAAFVDLDVGPNKPHRTKEAALAKLAELAMLAPPSAWNSSGGGVHAWWFFKEPMALDERARWVAIQARLVHALEGDPMLTSPHSVMRLPGTVNPKPELRGARARIIELHPERRTNPSDLEDALPVLPATSATPREHRGPLNLAHATELAPKVARVLEATRWALRVKAPKGRSAVALLARCPACAADPIAAPGAEKESAHVAPLSGRLRCKRAKCPAGGRSGIHPQTGEPLGIELAEWVTTYAPEALLALAPDTRPAWTIPDPADACATVEEADKRLPEAFADAMAWTSSPGDRPRAAVLVTPTGLGKSHEMLRQLAKQRARKRLRGTVLAQNHALLDEHEAKADGLGLTKRRRYRGLLQPRSDGGCIFADALQEWRKAAHHLRSVACYTCPHRENYQGSGKACRAYEGVEGPKGGVRFATHAHAAALGPQGELVGPVIVDELQDLLVERSVDVARDIGRRLTAEQWRPALRDFLEPRRPLAQAIVRAAAVLHEEWKRTPQAHPRRVSGEALREAARADGGTALAEGLRAFTLARNEEVALQRVPAPTGWEIREGRVSAEDWPLGDTDALLGAFAQEVTGQSGRRAAACLVVSDSGVRMEARWRFPGWVDKNNKPVPLVILDATAPAMREALESALSEYEVKFFRLTAPEPGGSVRRVWISTGGASRKRLIHEHDFLTHRGGPMFARIARAIGRALPDERASVGFVTHQPIARMIRAALDVLDGNDPNGEAAARIEKAGAGAVLEALRELRASRRMGHADVMHYGASRGSNRFEKFDVVVLIGDPWPDLGATAEAARALGIDPERYAVALRDAETVQALGRARAIRRTPEHPVTLVYVGAEAPAVWAGLDVDTQALPKGGPQASEATHAAEDLAHQLEARWGAVCPTLVRWLGEDPSRFAWLDGAREQSDVTVEQQVVIYSCVGLLPEGVAALAPRTLERAFSRALGDLPTITTGDPTRTTGGRWVWRESHSGAATALEARIRAYVPPVVVVDDSTAADVQPGDAPEALDVPEPIAWPVAGDELPRVEVVFRQSEADLAAAVGAYVPPVVIEPPAPVIAQPKKSEPAEALRARAARVRESAAALAHELGCSTKGLERTLRRLDELEGAVGAQHWHHAEIIASNAETTLAHIRENLTRQRAAPKEKAA